MRRPMPRRCLPPSCGARPASTRRGKRSAGFCCRCASVLRGPRTASTAEPTNRSGSSVTESTRRMGLGPRRGSAASSSSTKPSTAVLPSAPSAAPAGGSACCSSDRGKRSPSNDFVSRAAPSSRVSLLASPAKALATALPTAPPSDLTASPKGPSTTAKRSPPSSAGTWGGAWGGGRGAASSTGSSSSSSAPGIISSGGRP
mmetsp:Transcript_17823/g.54542  ORF Transcript_17823/g.54542 Transcript_17823/m.54542 type:complete len:201 (-) Transcript_17823:17-619(-)